jgi:hypothetical protein
MSTCPSFRSRRCGCSWSHREPANKRVTLTAIATVRYTCFAIAAALWPACSSPQNQIASPVRQIDHIMIRSEQPLNLYRLFVETFELPVAWDMATRGGVTSGGVGFGNVNVETIRFPGQTTRQSLLVGFALEPYPSLSESLADLDRRNIPYGALRIPPIVITPSTPS